MRTSEAYLAYKRLRRSKEGDPTSGDPAWMLLSADTAPEQLALMSAVFEGGARRRGQLETLRLFEKELLEIKRVGGSVDPTNPARYLNEMVKSGLVTRTKSLSDQDEQCELSSHGALAIQFIERMREPRSASNDSRLSMLAGQIARLNEESDENQKTRIAAKEAEIERIRREIDEIRAGRASPLTEGQALDRFRALEEARAAIVGDFGRVRHELMEVNRALLEKINGDDRGRGAVVNAILEGVDEVARSDSGMTTNTFYRLISDDAEMTRLRESIVTMLSRPFARSVEPRTLTAWRAFVRVLLSEGGRNQEVLNSLGRNLKNYVVSREYRQHRRLLELLRETQRRALLAKERTSTKRAVLELSRTGCRVSPISRYLLKDPAGGTMDASVEDAPPEAIDLEELALAYKDADIDFADLKEKIRAILLERGQTTVGELILLRGAPQGLASAVGYLVLAVEHGIRAEGSEVVELEIDEETVIRISMPRIYFARGVDFGD
jgi:hypothetical protein